MRAYRAYRAFSSSFLNHAEPSPTTRQKSSRGLTLLSRLECILFRQAARRQIQQHQARNRDRNAETA
jgi:hypothetical protein